MPETWHTERFCCGSSDKIGSLVCLYTLVSPSVPEMEGIYVIGGILLGGRSFGGVNIPFFTRMPGGVTIGDSGLCCCVPCLSRAIIALCLLRRSLDTIISSSS